MPDPDPHAHPAEAAGGLVGSRPSSGSRLRLEWAAGILLLATVIVVVARRTEEIRLVDLLDRAKPWWLIVAAALQLGTYAGAAGAWALILARQGTPQRIWRLIPLGLAKLFMDQMVPSAGVSGTMLVVRALERRGVPHGASVSSVIMGLLGIYAA